VLVDIDSTIALVGASGAIAAVMGAYLVWFPDAPVRTLLAFLFILIVRIRAKYLLLFWLVLQFFTAPDSGVAWVAHVGGFAFGAIVALLVRASGLAKRAVFARDHRDDPWDRTGGAGYGWYDRNRD
jgi:membrane associated rhomboid family serine protease